MIYDRPAFQCKRPPTSIRRPAPLSGITKRFWSKKSPDMCGAFHFWQQSSPPRALQDSVETVERSPSVCLRHGRVVERRVNEVSQRVGLPLLIHDRLPNVHDL